MSTVIQSLKMKIDIVKMVIKEKGFDILFLQKTEIPDGYNISLLNIPGFKLECLSIFDHVYVDDMSSVTNSLVCVTSIGKAKMTKFPGLNTSAKETTLNKN